MSEKQDVIRVLIEENDKLRDLRVYLQNKIMNLEAELMTANKLHEQCASELWDVREKHKQAMELLLKTFDEIDALRKLW